jgi:hypothetical protein
MGAVFLFLKKGVLLRNQKVVLVLRSEKLKLSGRYYTSMTEGRPNLFDELY